MKKKTRKTQNNVAISNQSNQRESYLLELFLSLQELLLGSPAAAALGLGHYLAVAALLDELVHDLRAFGIVDAGVKELISDYIKKTLDYQLHWNSNIAVWKVFVQLSTNSKLVDRRMYL